MIIKGYKIDIDFIEELEPYTFDRAKIRGEKLQACSPFRSEKSPSFAVNLENGTWIDSGAYDEKFRKGNFISLLSYLRQEGYEDTEAYLLEKYSTILSDVDSLKLEIKLEESKAAPRIFTKEELSPIWSSKSDYLTNRGISLEVQDLFLIGYYDGKIAMPWQDSKGNIINVKYRSILKKTFLYQKDGQAIKKHLYGLHQCIKKGATRVFICESETDALTLWTHGYYAIATGGGSLSDEQKNLILNSRIKELVIATDNDIVGKRFKEFLILEFLGFLDIFEIQLPNDVKDVNQLAKFPVNLYNVCDNLVKTKIHFF